MFGSLSTWSYFRWWVIFFCLSSVLFVADFELGLDPLWRVTTAITVPLKQQVTPLVMLWEKPLENLAQKQQLSEEVLILRTEVARELTDQSELARLREENRSLRNLLGAPIDGSWQMYPAQIIGQDGTGWWINAGTQDQLTLELPVLIDGIMLGIIDRIHPQQAHVLTLDQRKQSLQVKFRDSQTGEKHGVGLLEKDSQGLVVRGILPSDPVAEGDSVVTAGANMILPDIVIGRVISVGTTDETAFYKFARVLWSIPQDPPSHVAVVYDW